MDMFSLTDCDQSMTNSLPIHECANFWIFARTGHKRPVLHLRVGMASVTNYSTLTQFSQHHTVLDDLPCVVNGGSRYHD